MPLRIVILMKTNGGGRWILPQAEELRRRGHEVVAVLPPGRGDLTEDLSARGFTVLDSPFDFRFRPRPATLRGLWRLRRLIRRLRPDVLNYHLYASALAARLTTVGMALRRVHMVAGPLYLESPVIRPVERLLWRLDHVTICCTDHLSGLYGELGCPPRRRPVAQYGTDIGHYSPIPADRSPDVVRSPEARSKARVDVGVPDDVFLTVMVGYVYPPKRLAHRGRGIKGHDVLLAAWRAFSSRHPDSHLLIVGAGSDPAGAAYRDRLIDEFEVRSDPTVTWLDWVPDLRPYYLAADLNVIPSLSEGSNRVVREAAAMGVPSVVSDAGGLPEAVEPGYGWVVPRGDADALAGALRAAHHEYRSGLLPARGAAARRQAVRCFDRDLAAGRVADLIEHAAGTRR